MDPTIADKTCADWCCVSHSATALWLVVLFCASIFFAAAGYYLLRLHQINVKNGAPRPGAPSTTTVITAAR